MNIAPTDFRTLFFAALASIGLSLGCQPANSPAENTGAENKAIEATGQGSASVRDPDERNQDPDSAAPVTREDLDSYIAAFKANTIWHYGERTAGELIGTWLSDDGDGNRIVFDANGRFSQTFNDKMTTGLFAISDSGKIVACSKANGIGLSSHFQLDGQSITGPKGPNPSARWVRVHLKK